MKTVAALLVTVALALTACSGEDGPTSAEDPAPADRPSPAAEAPATIPAADGPVRSAGLPTVMDTGDGPELCLGAVAESYPPQCSGPTVAGWDWATYGDTAERQGDVRWGTYSVTGTWDGSTFTVTDAVPAALYDPMPLPPVELPEPSVELTGAELQELSDGLADTLPGYLSSAPDDAGHVLVDVVHDDGSLQTYLDQTYGVGVVVLSSALVDV